MTRTDGPMPISSLYGRWMVCLGLSLCLVGCANTRLSHEPGLVTGVDRQQPLGGAARAPELSLILHTRHLEFGEPSDPSVGKWWSQRKIRGRLEEVMGEFPFLAEAQWEATDAP